MPSGAPCCTVPRGPSVPGAAPSPDAAAGTGVARLRADLLADGGGDLLGEGDDRVGLAGLGDHLQAGLLVGDAGQVDLDGHPGSGRRGAGGLGGGGPVADDVVIADLY